MEESDSISIHINIWACASKVVQYVVAHKTQANKKAMGVCTAEVNQVTNHFLVWYLGLSPSTLGMLVLPITELYLAHIHI